MPEAIFFDLDDTLIAWETTPDEAWRGICESYAPGIDGFEPDRLFEAIRRASDWYWSDEARHRRGRHNLPEARREVVRLAFNNLGIGPSTLADEIADTYSNDRERVTCLVPGATDTLTRLRKSGIRLALVTNGGAVIQRGKIERFGLEPFFDFILVEGEFGIGKPDTRVFNHVLKTLDVRAGDAWMVGDDLKRDIAPCVSLGIYTVWVDGKGNEPSPGAVKPDRIIKTISELDQVG